jgi:predicted nucleotidyltransferase
MGVPLNPNDPNVAQLEVVASHLGEALRQQLVFVGGAVAGLLITDAAQPAIRPTEDVDLVAHVLARTDYYQLEQALRARGFTQDMRPGAPICRWTIERVAVDVMPTLDEVLGFSNRWYALAVETAQDMTLPSGAKILVITAPAFVATKLEAFAGRGGGDYLFSHDLGDVISVIDGRDGLWAEVQQTRDDLQAYLAEQFSQLMATRAFRDSLPGHLPGDAASQARLPDLEAKLIQLAQLTNT